MVISFHNRAMIPRRVETDSNLRERIIYHDSSLPIEICIDDYSTLQDNTLNCHWHEEFEFDLLTSGSVDFFVNGECFHMNAGDCIFINSSALHTATMVSGSNAVMLVTVMGQELLSPSPKGSIYRDYIAPVLSSVPGTLISSDEVKSAIERIHSLDESAFGFQLEVLSHYSALWRLSFPYIAQYRRKAGQGGEKEEKVKALISYIRANYSEEIDISTLASVAGFSRSELYRSFAQYANADPMEYVASCRLAAASALLVEGELSITDIALSTGFSSSSYFGKFFRHHTGFSPGEFRKNHVSTPNNSV